MTRLNHAENLQKPTLTPKAANRLRCEILREWEQCKSVRVVRQRLRLMHPKWATFVSDTIHPRRPERRWVRPEEQQRIRELRERGLSTGQVAYMVKRTTTTVRKFCR